MPTSSNPVTKKIEIKKAATCGWEWISVVTFPRLQVQKSDSNMKTCQKENSLPIYGSPALALDCDAVAAV